MKWLFSDLFIVSLILSEMKIHTSYRKYKYSTLWDDMEITAAWVSINIVGRSEDWMDWGRREAEEEKFHGLWKMGPPFLGNGCFRRNIFSKASRDSIFEMPGSLKQEQSSLFLKCPKLVNTLPGAAGVTYHDHIAACSSGLSAGSCGPHQAFQCSQQQSGWGRAPLFPPSASGALLCWKPVRELCSPEYQLQLRVIQHVFPLLLRLKPLILLAVSGNAETAPPNQPPFP